MKNSNFLTNFIIKKDLSVTDGFSDNDGIEKSVVKQHTRRTKSGKITTVKQYIDSRQKKSDDKDVANKKENKTLESEKNKLLNVLDKWGKAYGGGNIQEKAKELVADSFEKMNNHLNEIKTINKKIGNSFDNLENVLVGSKSIENLEELRDMTNDIVKYLNLLISNVIYINSIKKDLKVDFYSKEEE